MREYFVFLPSLSASSRKTRAPSSKSSLHLPVFFTWTISSCPFSSTKAVKRLTRRRNQPSTIFPYSILFTSILFYHNLHRKAPSALAKQRPMSFRSHRPSTFILIFPKGFKLFYNLLIFNFKITNFLLIFSNFIIIVFDLLIIIFDIFIMIFLSIS